MLVVLLTKDVHGLGHLPDGGHHADQRVVAVDPGHPSQYYMIQGVH